MQKYIAAIEIGSSAIKGAVGVHDSASDTVLVLATEQVPVAGCVRYGWINNVEEARACVEAVLASLEKAPGVRPRRIESVYVGLSGRSFGSSTREVALRLNEEQKITSETLAQLSRDARDSFFTDKEIIEVTPRQFVIDNGLISNPIGAYSSSISATYNIITCRPQLIRNLRRTFDDIQPSTRIAGLVVLPLAEAEMVLTKDERRRGCMLVDFGAETTSLAVFKDGALRYLSTLPMGSRNITTDLTSLEVTEEQAEEFKCLHGNAIHEPNYSHSSHDLDPLGSDTASQIVSARAGEIVANIIAQISYAGLRSADLQSGFILTGGGSRLRNFGHLLSEESGLKVRQGVPSQAVSMADGSTRQVSDTDILATLLAAARRQGAIDCLTMPAPVTPTVQQPAQQPRQNQYTGTPTRRGGYVIDESLDRDDDDLMKDDDDNFPTSTDDGSGIPRRKSTRKIGIFDKLSNRLADLIKGPDDDDDI